ncbi:hypothetical protein KKC97_13960, partial [bacterium]|nr:hypothetical protein [bacterium]
FVCDEMEGSEAAVSRDACSSQHGGEGCLVRLGGKALPPPAPPFVCDEMEGSEEDASNGDSLP